MVDCEGRRTFGITFAEFDRDAEREEREADVAARERARKGGEDEGGNDEGGDDEG